MEAAASGPAAARRALADAAAASLLRMLRLGRARGIFHCDVRPANHVVELQPASRTLRRVLLIDWDWPPTRATM